MFADGVPEEPGFPPLQATCHTIRNSTAIHEKRPSMTSSNPPETSAGADHNCAFLGKHLICRLTRKASAKTAMPVNCRFWKGRIARSGRDQAIAGFPAHIHVLMESEPVARHHSHTRRANVLRLCVPNR